MPDSDGCRHSAAQICMIADDCLKRDIHRYASEFTPMLQSNGANKG